MDRGAADLHPTVLAAIEDGDDIDVVVRLPDATIVLSGQRLIVTRSDRMALILPMDGLRRIQFDVEKRIASTFVIVPEHVSHEPQVLPIPVESVRDVAALIVLIAERLADFDTVHTPPVA